MTLLQPEQSIEARELLNLSQAKVARETGINRTYLSQFENGQRILKDAENDALYGYYDTQGLDVEGLAQTLVNTGNTTSPDAQMVTINDLKPAYSVNPSRIKDGIVVSRNLDSDTVETLMAEYYELENTIVTQLKQPVSRTFLFNDIDAQETFNTAKTVLLACYRQRQIKLALHGQSDITNKQSSDRVNVIREFLNGKLEEIDKR